MHKTRNKIKEGFVLSYISMGISTLIGLVFTPFILKMLGQNEYGLYSLIGSLVSYLSLLDLGVSTTTIRFVSKYRIEGNKIKLEQFVGTCFVIYAGISLVVLLVGIICCEYINIIFASSLHFSQIGKARIMFAILVVNLTLSFVGHIYPAIMMAYDDFVLIKKIEIGKNLLRTLLLFVLLSLGNDSLAIVIVDASLNIAIIIIQYVYVQFSLKVNTIPQWTKSTIKEIFSFSSFVFLSTLINQVNFRVGSIVLGIVSNTVQVAIFALGMTLFVFYQQLSGAFSSLFMPKLTQLIMNDRPMDEVEDLLIRVSRFQTKLLTLIIIGFIAVGKEFIHLWAGNGYKQTYSILLFMMIAYYLPYTQTTLNTLAQVLNKHKIRNSIYGISALVNIILMFILAEFYGAIGPAISTLITMLIGYGLFIQLYYKQGMGVNMLRYLKETYFDTIPVAIGSVAAGFLVNQYLNGTWLNLAINIIILTFVYAILTWLFGSSEYEKKQIVAVFKKLEIHFKKFITTKY